jgi:hypothetical protein
MAEINSALTKTLITLAAPSVVPALMLASFVKHSTHSKALGQAQMVKFPAKLSKEAKIELLEGDFKIISKASDLPPAVLQTFKETGGSCLVLADPDEKFNPTDVIYDARVPQERLIIAGVSKNKAFVHYERGGRGRSYIIEVFEVENSSGALPLWRDFCRQPAKTVENLRAFIASGDCS